MVVKAEFERTVLLSIGICSLLAGIVVAIYLWDRPAEALLQAKSGTPLLALAELVGILGQPLPYITLGLLALLFWGIILVNTGFSFSELLLPYRALLVLLAAVAPWTVALALQAIFGRSRPHLYIERGIYTFHPFNLGPDFSSFPSSHAAVAAAMAAVFSTFLPTYRLTFFVLAALVAVSRVAAGYHYPSDAVAGMLLGIVIVVALERGFDWVGIDIRGAKAKWR
ncbi:MAG TPA: phosphatase PAP2 family protein [Rhizomicrobium sp.]|nr:phosphatase PAP2 family protein [Rhizomicrobium sp.]